MKYLLTASLLFCSILLSFGQYEPKVKDRTFTVSVKDGICSFNGVSIGDQLDDINGRFGETPLVNRGDKRSAITTLFYPDYGLTFNLEGEYVRAILLYPQEGSIMGDVEKFKIYSRNTNNWRFKDLPLNGAQPQDVMTTMGTESINTKLGTGITSAISNNVMGYKLINKGGSQDVIFYFDSKESIIEHITNRISE